MPYKNEEKRKEAQRDWVRKKRSKGSTEIVQSVEPVVEPKLNKWGAPVTPPNYVDPRTVEPEYRRIIQDLGLGDIYIKPEERRSNRIINLVV